MPSSIAWADCSISRIQIDGSLSVANYKIRLIPYSHARYCQRTTASGACLLRPAEAERSWFGNAIFGWAVRLYVSKRKTRTKSTDHFLGRVDWARSKKFEDKFPEYKAGGYDV